MLVSVNIILEVKRFGQMVKRSTTLNSQIFSAKKMIYTETKCLALKP
jgi:hypothetical protein